MRTTIIVAVLLVGCNPSQHASIDPVAKIDAAQWEVKATEWPLGEGRYCYLFPGDEPFTGPFAGCWEQYEEQQLHNRNDHPNDHAYLMKISLPENVKQALAQGHNQKAFCARDEAMHLSPVEICRNIQ